MKVTKRIWIRSMVGAAAAAALTGAAWAQGAPIKIGVLATLEGPFAAGGADGMRGAELALRQRNGMVAGRKVEMIRASSNANPDVAVNAVRKLVEQDKVDIVVGPLSGGEGIAVKEPGSYTRKLVAELNDDIVLVAERHLERAVSLLLQIEKTVVEGAGAAGLAAMLAHPEEFAGRKVGLVLTGGNIDTRLLANVLLRDLARSGRIARLRIRLQDRPGALFNVMKLFDEKQVNIIEIYHQRIFTTLPAKGLIIDIECEARDREHLDSLVASLRDAGYMVTTVELA